MIETIAWSCDFVYSFRLHTYTQTRARTRIYRLLIYPTNPCIDTTMTMTRRLYFSLLTSPWFDVFFIFFLLLCYVFLCMSVRRCVRVRLCVIFCLFDFDEPALLLLHMLNMSLYYAITILILPQVSFIWLIKFGTHNTQRTRQIIRNIWKERNGNRGREQGHTIQKICCFLQF